ncbi:MAG: GNAT family protein [Polyangiaceae bacterium]
MLAIPRRVDVRARPLGTARLVLHPLEGVDTPELWPLVEANRGHLEPWLPWVPFTYDLDATLRYADASGGDWDAGRATRFAIRERAHGDRLIGVVGLENVAHLHRSADLGYWLAISATGAGLMTEACRAVVAWAFGTVGLHRLRVAAGTENGRSLAVIRRLGFRFEGVAREAEFCHGRFLDHAVFARLESDAPG